MTSSKIPGAAKYVPRDATCPELSDAAQKCKGCELYRNATQAVLGEGPASARILMVGEQPGDKEDLAGKPFVGPAGALLDRALADAGIDRSDVYITNAVKHFKFEERGKRRIHKKPSETEVVACRPWLDAEMACVRPEIVVCLGATAARSLIGKQHRVLRDRGLFVAASHGKEYNGDGTSVRDLARARPGTAPCGVRQFCQRLESGSTKTADRRRRALNRSLHIDLLHHVLHHVFRNSECDFLAIGLALRQ